jgi:hypothetical protein
MSVVMVEQKGLVSIIRINRPEKLNAISNGVAVELQRAFEAFDASAQRVAILSAVGERAFTSGADVTDLPELWRAIPGVGFRTDKPIIAATSGWCVGGGIVMVMRDRNGNDVRLDGVEREHHLLLSGGEAGRDSRDDQFPCRPHAAQAGNGNDAAGIKGAGQPGL